MNPESRGSSPSDHPGMTWPITDTPAHSRGRKPTRAMHRSCPSKMRAQGMPGAWTAPAASRAKQKSTRDSHHGSAERAGIPCANGFNGLLRALPGDRAFLSPSPARCESIVANLTPASRRQNHTTSPSASMRFVSRTVASTASRPNVTIAIRPSSGTGWAEDADDLGETRSKLFLRTRLDR